MRVKVGQSLLGNEKGLSLIEVTMIIVIVAIVMAVAMQSMTPGLEKAKKRKTEHEMEIIMHAIVGDPEIMSVAGGVRSDFGYVGDVGAFPPNLDALLANPGGYSTWNGPYIDAEFIEGILTDEWGNAYSYSGGLEIVSNGSGSSIRNKSGSDSLDYLINTINGLVMDVNDSIPGPVYDDSVDIEITFPDGAGSVTTKTYHPDSTGLFSLDSIPMGRHRVRAIYVPEVDTLSRYVTVLPRHDEDEYIRFNFASGWFTGDTSGGGGGEYLTLVEGTGSADGAECQNVTFDLANNTGADIEVTTIRASWSGVTAYYQTIRWEGTLVFSGGASRIGDETTVDITPQTVSDGDTASVVIEEFRDKVSGSASRVNMGGVQFQIVFSDGSQIEFTTPGCP